MEETVVTIADQVFAEIRKAIVEGEIPRGSKIGEPGLARRFGISRGPLREAMQRLESANLVERRPNVGARVITLSNEQLLEIFHVREALEGMAARLAASHMSQDESADLRELLIVHRRQVERDGGQAYLQREGDLDFHYRIVEGSHNIRLKGLLCNDLYHLVRMYRFQFGMASPRARPALDEHGHILEAIEGRDGELAEFLMRRHIRASRKNVERRLAEDMSRTKGANGAKRKAEMA
jgi:DNA-binding GntR family transcriptional regulator